MPQDVLIALISVISGGGLTAFVKLLIDYLKNKNEIQTKNIDDRIIAWQKISEKHESKLNILEKKIESYDRDFISLERYIISLEQTMLRAIPPLDLPVRPKLERETVKFFWDSEINIETKEY